MKDAQVERQHHQHEQVEDEPEGPVSVHAPGSEIAGTNILSAKRLRFSPFATTCGQSILAHCGEQRRAKTVTDDTFPRTPRLPARAPWLRLRALRGRRRVLP